MVVQKQTVESEIQFQNREMLEVLLHAFYRQELLSDGLASHCLGSFRDLPSEPIRGIDLPQPSCIPVTGRAHGHAGMEVAEEEFFYVRNHFQITRKARRILIMSLYDNPGNPSPLMGEGKGGGEKDGDSSGALFDGLVKSQGTAFRSWFDTSPRTENQTLMVFMIRSP